MTKKIYKVSSDYSVVKSAYSDISGELVQKMLPFGWGLDKYKGLRRRAVLRIWAGSKMYKFKVAMYSSTKQKYYLHIVNAEDGPFNLKFFSTRISVIDKSTHTEITETLEFTTKNKWLDNILSLFINIHYTIKGMKYKLFFLNK
tara:strand:+ start:57 stop:488 length:432 start_codon:yes stop_codon:yes gene_type:complete